MNTSQNDKLRTLATAPLWLSRLILPANKDATPESLQSQITQYVEQTHRTTTGCFIPSKNELLLLHWPETREGYSEQSIEECGQVAADLTNILNATREPFTLAEGEVLCMMGLKVGGYDDGRIAELSELAEYKDKLTMIPAHMVSARSLKDGSTESYGEPTVLLRGALQNEPAIHAIGDQLEQYHYGIHYGGGETKFYETRWADEEA